MKNLYLIFAMTAVVATLPTVGLAANNANAAAPGQDRTCLVTTGVPNSWADTDVTSTKWLPRKAAEARAQQDPTTMKVFDYADDPLVKDGIYASAEELCNKHFVK